MDKCFRNHICPSGIYMWKICLPSIIIMNTRIWSENVHQVAYNYCIKADALASDLLNKNIVQFWNQVDMQSSNKLPLANTVGGATGHNNIASMWCSHFKDLFTNVKSETDKDYALNGVSDIKKCITLFNVYEIRKVNDSLEKGKSGGLDNLSAEHLLYAGQRLDIMLSLLFNLCIVHGFLPDHLISNILIPIIKDKSSNVIDKGNYRPIALSSVISKVLEVLLLDSMEYYLFTSDNQFGFKSKHSTHQCIYILKELIEFYRSHNSPMYLCFLDASKAFDRVNHWTMFKKHLLRGVPPILVRLMLFWYRSQQICVPWGSATSTSFKVLNGVRQGGILSPILFNVYIDDLSYELSKCKSGCIIENKIVNDIAYADDLIVFCPSSKGLQKLLDICDSYGNTHDIKYNQKKTVCMLILPRGYKLHNIPILTINSHELSFVNQYKYLGIITLNTFMDDEDIS